MNGGSMRRIQERVLGLYKTSISSSTSDIWHLGLWYKISQEDSSSDLAISDGLAAFVEDFSSRILLTYCKGFVAIGDSKYTSDVNWGCMLRSSQMLVAQALIVHQLGRSWRKTSHKRGREVELQLSASKIGGSPNMFPGVPMFIASGLRVRFLKVVM
ncbi:Cysteine protease ATG4 [Camellia lanceoleosa]|uniref:Cysteine protease ATG4 n=1 Tax=Camellia lanceoleosa TaxID=1840588 RepID=A0ACC0F9Y7_9ERIC|nr:Cysteine protease ATG4 [Camellia lanceoleosa]